MLNHNTLEQLRALNCTALPMRSKSKMHQPDIHAMSFEERLVIPVPSKRDAPAGELKTLTVHDLMKLYHKQM